MRELLRLLKELAGASWSYRIIALVFVLLLAGVKFARDWAAMVRVGVYVVLLVGSAFLLEFLDRRYFKGD